ncbi:MAG: hypothetical protein GWN47_03215, partial [Woeseiaceae bacterium]|nr:hypothetical protein [Woeseiaceae bacterium]
MGCALVAMGLLAPVPAAAQLTVPTQCTDDLGGANDEVNQGDLTRWCVDFGTGDYELVAKWNWDDTSLPGGNTGDACTLYDTDGDGNANLAVCVSWGGNGVQEADSPTLYTCDGDARPDRCSQPTLLTGTFNTTCEVNANVADDPFAAGNDYPNDTEAVCAIDVDDFNQTGTPLLIDACSYPAGEPNSAPKDCIVSAACTTNDQCNDGNACTTGICDPDLDICRFTPNTGVTCRVGSGDICDPDELCNALGQCPADIIAPTTTVCNPGSGDSCDPDELCTGVAGAACPADSFEPATTVCNAGSGDLCDPDEYCSGNPDVACAPGSTNLLAQGTVCNPGSGDICDPEEVCSGIEGEACPADSFEPSTTVCRVGSGDSCDPSEFCSGNPDEACPANFVTPSGTECRGSGGVCDPAEQCTGVL